LCPVCWYNENPESPGMYDKLGRLIGPEGMPVSLEEEVQLLKEGFFWRHNDSR